ncbi:NF-kappa-B inhibitor cactus [Culicoides brevitarsis]|uniref:NF-kappa-B inhibitor cactus n=1 Tax=Culicoides brevitarsis TaxID=469753 RepID=UPI00307C9E1B
MSENNRSTSPSHFQKKEQEESVDLDSGFVSSYIESGPINSTSLDASDYEKKLEVEQDPKQDKLNQQQTNEQEMDSAYIDSGLLSSDMSKLEINPQIILPKDTNNEVYFQPNEDGDTLLHLAIIWPHETVAKTLIKLAPDSSYLNIQNDIYLTPMHLAVLTEQPELVRDLVIGGAKTTIRDRRGNTALHLACLNGHKDCVKQLLTPLDLFEKNRSPISGTLSFNLETWNYDGETCIHLAAKCGKPVRIEIIKILVEFGADINAREGKQGRTILHRAVEEGDESLVQLLLKECPKLDVNICTYAGLSAYQMAFANASYNQKFKIIAQVLLKRGADSTPMISDDSESEDELMPPSNQSRLMSSCPVNVV